MKTAEEIYKYCIDNNFGMGMTKSWTLKHFSIIEKILQDDEEIHVAFVGLHDYKSLSNHKNNCAYAITNKRMIVAQKKFIGEYLQIIELKDLRDVSIDTKFIMGFIQFKFGRESFKTQFTKIECQNLLNKIQLVIGGFSQMKEYSQTDTDRYADLLKIKELFDNGVFTEEEYIYEKNRILNR